MYPPISATWRSVMKKASWRCRSELFLMRRTINSVSFSTGKRAAYSKNWTATKANHQYHIHEASGLWCRYLCTLSAFLVEQHFLHISQMVPMSKCLDSMCWITRCLILLINPHSRQNQSPVKDLCIFRLTRHSRTRS